MSVYLLPALVGIGLAANESDTESWNDFANDFATDLAPIIALFGEQVTKQFLSESTSFLDIIIFGVAPLGIITAVVSVIRVYGNASFKSFIGRAQEPHGIAEAELCSSTSDDVCEMWSNGGICRVFGRPKILEFFFNPGSGDFYPKFSACPVKGVEVEMPSCGIDVPKLSYCSNKFARYPDGIKYWKEIDSNTRSSKNDETESLLDGHAFAPHPNLSLNIGIRTLPRWVSWVAAIFGVLLQLSFYGYATWMTFYNDSGKEAELWAFCLVVVGTTMIVVGMTLCAVLIDGRSEERRFAICKSPGGLEPSVHWLQPGGQRIGDQLFHAFAHSEKKRVYMTSWRKEVSSGKWNWLPLLLAVAAAIIGFILQFVGLRGVHGSIALYQLAATVLMAIIRALLRVGRLKRGANQLENWGQDSEGHELDWQALHLPTHSTPLRSWLVNDQPQPLKCPDTGPTAREVTVLGYDPSNHATESTDLERKGQIVGFCASSAEDQESRDTRMGKHCAELAVAWMRFNEQSDRSDHLSEHSEREPNEAAISLHFRRRLAYLTDAPGDQGWHTEARTVAAQLKEAIQDSAYCVFQSESMLPEEWRDAKSLIWSTTCEGSDNAGGVPILFHMHRLESGWEIDEHHLEGIISLWYWSLTSPRSAPGWFSSKNIVASKGTSISATRAAIRLWITSTQPLEERYLCRGNRYYSSKALSALSSSVDPNRLSQHSRFGAEALVFSIKTKGTPLQKIAQDIFTIFMSRIATIMMPLDGVDLRLGQADDTSLRNAVDRPYMGLTNPHVQIIADKFVNSGLGSREEALMSIIPPLLRESKLPKLEEVIGDLIIRARSLRRSDEFQQAEGLLKTLFHLGPRHDEERILVELGEAYRAAIRSKSQNSRDFGQRGLARFERPLAGVESIGHLKVVLDNYAAVSRYFGHRNSQRFPSHGVNATIELKRQLETRPVRPQALLLVDEFDIEHASLQDAQSVLKWAIEKNCPELIEDLWNIRKQLVEEVETEGLSPIFWALSSESETLQRLLEWPDISFDEHDYAGFTPLFRAAALGKPTAAKLLIDKGADIRKRSTDGQTVLSVAVLNRRPEIIGLLLRTEPSLDIDLRHVRRSEHGSVLEAAIEYGWNEVVGMILENSQLYAGWSTMQGIESRLLGTEALVAASRAGNIEAVRALVLDWGVDANTVAARMAHNALEKAVIGDHIDIVEFLLKEGGADIDKPSPTVAEHHGSILILAASGSKTEIVRILLRHGAQANEIFTVGPRGCALIAALLSDSPDAKVDCLLEDGKALVDLKLNGEGAPYASPLEAVARVGDCNMVDLLVKKGATVDLLLEHGPYGSALIAAVSEGHLKVVQTLVDKGAEIDLSVKHGDYGSALIAAAATGNREIIKFLLKRGGDINKAAATGKHASALAALLQNRSFDLIKFLIEEAGARADMPLTMGPCGNALVAAVSTTDIRGFFDRSTFRIMLDQNREAVNMSVEHGRYGSVLAAAAYWGHMSSFDILLEAGADPNMELEHGEFRTAYEAAEAEFVFEPRENIQDEKERRSMKWVVTNGKRQLASRLRSLQS